MTTFKDSTGRTWTIEINLTTIKRVRSLCDVDLLEVLDGKDLITKLMTDPILLGDVLYAVCKPQADSQSITDEQFGEALAGDAIDDATTNLLAAIVNFSPNRRDRAAAEKVMHKTWETMDRARDLVEARLENQMAIISTQSIDELARSLEKVDPVASGHQSEPGNSSGDAPESSESTQQPTAPA